MAAIHLTATRLLFVAGRSEDGERPHQPQGSWSGWLGGTVQNQKAHSTQQTNEGVLRKTGELTLSTQKGALEMQCTRRKQLLFTLCIVPTGRKFVFCLQGVSIRQIRFRFDGQPINEADTPAQVGKSWISVVY